MNSQNLHTTLTPVAVEFSKRVLSRYRGEHDRIIFIITDEAKKLGIDPEDIKDYLTENIYHILREESENHHMIERDDESETYSLI